MSSNTDDKKPKEPRKVIDIAERISARLEARGSEGPVDKLKAFKVRLDLEQAKIAIPVSLLSIVVVVTLANSSLLSTSSSSDGARLDSREVASTGTLIPARGIASVPSGTSQSEDELVKQMSEKTLSEAAAIGRSPSALEKLSIETLQGRYAIRMTDTGKLSEIKISQTQIAKAIEFDRGFIEAQRDWMPVKFDKSIRVKNVATASGREEQYHLVNALSMPVGRVDVELDGDGHLLTLKVVPTAIAGSGQ